MDNKTVQPETAMKICMECRTLKPLSEFASRSGGRAGRRRRRGTCKACRQRAGALEPAAEMNEIAAAEAEAEEAIVKPKRRRGRRRRKAGKLESVAETIEAVVVETEDEPDAKPKRRRRRRRRKVEAIAEISEAIVAEPEEEPLAKPKRGRRRRRRKAKKPSVPQVAAAAAVPAATPASEAAVAVAKRTSPASATRKAASRKSPISKPEAPKIAAGAPKLDPHDADSLRATRQGFVRMRGKTDSGRSYYQEIEPEFAKTLVREHAAYVVNRHTIRRIHSNREFRRLILTRDNYTCHFCGEYGDTIDHLLPRAKGGHTTPVNCVCACNECNQSKADRDLDEFTESLGDRRRLEPTV